MPRKDLYNNLFVIFDAFIKILLKECVFEGYEMRVIQILSFCARVSILQNMKFVLQVKII